MNQMQIAAPRTGDHRSTNLRDSPLMAHLMDALERGEDTGHYGRLIFAIVARHFLPEAELLRLLGNCPAHGAAEARVMLEEVRAHDYTAPMPETIRAWQAHQSFPLYPGPETPEGCNLYRDLPFPERVYAHLEEDHSATQPAHKTVENAATPRTSRSAA